MAKETIKTEMRVDVVTLPDSSVVENPTGEILCETIKATPRSGGAEYIRLQFAQGGSYRWNAPVADWSDSVENDDPRWIAE